MNNIEFPLLLAVASKDGLSINEHFGHVKQFRIYQLSPDHCQFLESREVAHYCLGQHADESAMLGILATVKDCYAVFVAKIGDGPTDKLKAIGVAAISGYAYEAIDASLLDYGQHLSAVQEASMKRNFVSNWLLNHPLSAIHVDCATTVMLKIIDGKCKMQASEKQIMELLYDEAHSLPGQLLDASIHALIAEARIAPNDAMKNLIYEKRLLAETTISRPVMKGFKALIRQQGLLEANSDYGIEPD